MNPTKNTSSLGAVVLATIALVSPSARAASAPCPADTGIALEVVAELGDPADDEAMREYLLARLPDRVDDLCVDERAPDTVEIVVAWSNAARGDYAIALRAIPEEGDPFEPDPVDCPACATAEVLDVIAGQVPLALEGLHADAAPEHEPTPHDPVAKAPRSTAPPVSPTRSRPRLSRLGHAGIGLAAASAAGVVTGAILWSRGYVPHPTDEGFRLRLAPAGIALVSAGIVGLAAAGTMIGIDARRHGRRRVTLHPKLGRAHLGLTISGTF